MIDFELPAELAELRTRVRSFVRDRIVPFENDPRQTPHGPTDELRLEMVALSRAEGLLSPHAPLAYGGMGLDHRGIAVVFEAAGWSTLGALALNIQAPDEGNCHMLDVCATEAQKQRYLAPIATGEGRSVFSMTETTEDGAGAVLGGLGHRKHRAAFAGGDRRQIALLLRLGGADVEHVAVALVRRLDVERQRSQGGPAGRFEHHRDAAMIQAHAAVGQRRVRRQQPLGPGQRDHFQTQLVGGSVRRLPRIVLEGHDPVAHEAAHASAQFGQFGGKFEIDHAGLPARNSSRPRANRVEMDGAKRSHSKSGRRPLRCSLTLRQAMAPMR